MGKDNHACAPIFNDLCRSLSTHNDCGKSGAEGFGYDQSERFTGCCMNEDIGRLHQVGYVVARAEEQDAIRRSRGCLGLGSQAAVAYHHQACRWIRYRCECRYHFKRALAVR
jgi:hypothetical protein